MMAGMTWARAAIFHGSDRGRQALQEAGVGHTLSVTAPPLVVSTFVQVVNMPLIRSSIMLQNPTATQTSVLQMSQHIIKTRGFFGLWHGLKSVFVLFWFLFRVVWCCVVCVLRMCLM